MCWSTYTADKFGQYCEFQQFLVLTAASSSSYASTGSSCSSPAQASFVSRPSMVYLLSTLHCSPLTEPSFSPIFQVFRPTSSCLLLCSYVLQMVSMNTNRYFMEILQILWKTPWFWCVLKIPSPQKTSCWALKPLSSLQTDFIMYSFLPLHPIFGLTIRV